MSTYTHPTSRTDASPTEQQRTELSELRTRLFNKYEYLRDDAPELHAEIDAWLTESVTLPDGNVGSAVKSRLRSLKKKHKMRNHRGVDNGEAAFPEDCEQCPHYGVACPMLKRHSVTKTLERIIKTAETDDDLVDQLSDLAIEHDCHVVLEELDAYQDSYGEFLKRGYELHSRAQAVLAGEDPDATEYDFANYDDGPPPEAQAQVEATVEAVMNDDEDGDDL
ncbi:hypothetical protein [Natronosalvus halobius]|uniref:hypothetical protein n=1 Tax=Natronosalvus halobius TaxID=2953746 RepID=UPI00209E8563|nr:hypothetical protein [Natronosalvus halobius]USZ73788.1 hypothetical protein NGM15_18450 [Natronosalvus halobius]